MEALIIIGAGFVGGWFAHQHREKVFAALRSIGSDKK